MYYEALECHFLLAFSRQLSNRHNPLCYPLMYIRRKQCQSAPTIGDAADADLSLALRMDDDQFLSLDDIPVANNIDLDEQSVSKVLLVHLQ